MPEDIGSTVIAVMAVLLLGATTIGLAKHIVDHFIPPKKGKSEENPAPGGNRRE
ncbi:MAG: hypothetical protein OXR67_08080 [Chloroflexota bacterium]|nr:hypothetical protein [Chloroflexota bacterium]